MPRLFSEVLLEFLEVDRYLSVIHKYPVDNKTQILMDYNQKRIELLKEMDKLIHGDNDGK